MTEIVRVYDRDGGELKAKADVGPDGRLIRGDEGFAEIATRFLEERSVDEILTYLDGPHMLAMAIDVDDLDYDPSLKEKRNRHLDEPQTKRGYRLSKDWIRYQGPFGGEGWQHVETGDVRYVDDPPGEVAQEGQTQTTLDTGAEIDTEFDLPNWFNDEVARTAVYHSLPDEAYEAIVEYAKEGEIGYSNQEVSGEYDLTGSQWLEGAGKWIEQHGDRSDVREMREYLDDYNTKSPWGETDAPDHLNPEKAASVEKLWNTDADAGVSAESMMIAEMESGDRVFLTNVRNNIPGELDSEWEMDAVAANETAKFLTAFGENVPEHHYEEGEFLAVAEANGAPIDGPGRNDINERDFISYAAKQLLAGNRDAHSQNVFSAWEGLITIDLDLASKRMDSRELPEALGTLYDTAVEAGIYEPYSDEEADKFVEQVKKEAESWASGESVNEALEAIDDEKVRERIEFNVEQARKGELLDENQEMRTML